MEDNRDGRRDRQHRVGQREGDGSFGPECRLHLSVVPEQLMARGVTFPVVVIVPTPL